MLSEIFRHWRYFVPRLLGYGTVIGTLFGALTYPILGALVGAPWGFGAGLLMGILMGIGVPIYNELYAPDDSAIYQTQLTFGAGMLTLIVMAIPMLFIYALPAGMVAAYLAHQYAENPPNQGEKRKHTIDAYQKREKTFTMSANFLMGKAHYVVALGVFLAMAGALILELANGFFPWFLLAMIAVGGTIYGYLIAGIIAVTVSLFVVMANRIFFDVDMPKSQYKPRIVASVAVLTLFLSMIVTAGIGAPFAAIAGAFGASKYADWYYELDDEEKAKRSADNLADDDSNNDAFFAEDDDSEKISRSS
ncbi:MAG: hypothetical protein Phog2KO_40560 [Phototrophicaceae bacterium]